MIKLLEDALMLAADLEHGTTGYLMERALDEARSREFMPTEGVLTFLGHANRRASAQLGARC